MRLWEHHQIPKGELANECQMTDKWHLSSFFHHCLYPTLIIWFAIGIVFIRCWCTYAIKTSFLYLWNALNTLKTKINVQFMCNHLLLRKERNVLLLSRSVGKCCLLERYETTKYAVWQSAEFLVLLTFVYDAGGFSRTWLACGQYELQYTEWRMDNCTCNYTYDVTCVCLYTSCAMQIYWWEW